MALITPFNLYIVLSVSQFKRFMEVIKKLGDRVEKEHDQYLRDSQRIEDRSATAVNGASPPTLGGTVDFESLVGGQNVGTVKADTVLDASKGWDDDVWGSILNSSEVRTHSKTASALSATVFMIYAAFWPLEPSYFCSARPSSSYLLTSVFVTFFAPYRQPFAFKPRTSNTRFKTHPQPRRDIYSFPIFQLLRSPTPVTSITDRPISTSIARYVLATCSSSSHTAHGYNYYNSGPPTCAKLQHYTTIRTDNALCAGATYVRNTGNSASASVHGCSDKQRHPCTFKTCATDVVHRRCRQTAVKG